jgi:hypothetical protein
VPGDDMEVHLQDNQVASTEAIQGTKDGVTYNLMMKEANYVMKMMATSDNLVVDKSCHSSARQRINNGAEVVKEFQFKLSFDLHFHCFNIIHDHNNLWHALLCLDDT